MEFKRALIKLNSLRSTDRIRGLKDLSQLLDSAEALETLYPPEDVPVTFDRVYVSFHEALVREAVRLQGKRVSVGVPSAAPAAAASAFHSEMKRVHGKIMGKTSEDKCKISVDNLMRSLNQIFGSPLLRITFGAQYYSLVVATLLKHRSYWGELNGKYWRELIKLSIVAFNDGIPGLDSSRVIKYLALILTQGNLNCDLTTWIAEKYKFVFDTVSATDSQTTNASESSMMLALSFVTKVAKGNREMACKFGETIMDKVLSFYDPSVSETTLLKSLVLEFLIFQINIHHPIGATRSSFSYYAYDNMMWEQGLKRMTFRLKQEVIHNSQKIPVTYSGAPLRGRFVEFAVELVYQIINIPCDREYAGEMSIYLGTPRQSEIESGFQIVVEILKESAEGSLWCWLYIISVMLKRYQCTDERSYIGLLEYLSEFMSTKRTGVTLDCFFRCCASFASVPVPSTCDVESYIPAWQKIWDATVCSIGVKQCEESAQETICAILGGNLMHSERHITDLFNSFIENQLSPYEGSIKTLHKLLMSYNIVDELAHETRQMCLMWIYPGKDKLEVFKNILSVKLIAEILAQLCVKENIRKSPPVRIPWKGGPLEQFYTQMEFCSGLLIPREKASGEASFIFPDIISLDAITTGVLKNMMANDSDSLVSSAQEILLFRYLPHGVLSVMEFMSFVLQLNLLVASYLIQWKVLLPTSEEIESILDSSKKILLSLGDLVCAHQKSNRENSEVKRTYLNLMSLYEMEVDDHISIFLRENTPSKLMNSVIKVLKREAETMTDTKPQFMKSAPDRHFQSTLVYFTDFYSILDSRIFAENTQLLNISCKIVGAFCCAYGGHPYTVLQTQTIIYFLSNLPKETTGICLPLRLQMLMEFLYLPVNKMAMTTEILSVSLKKLQLILCNYPNDVELLQIILSVLEEISLHAVENDTVGRIVIKASEFYLKTMYRVLVERRLPSNIQTKAVKLIGCLVKISPDLTWPWLLDRERNQITLSNFLMQELDNPHADVRMVVAETLYSTLYPLQFQRDTEQRASLDAYFKSILGSCPQEESEAITRYERKNYLKIAVHCLCIVAVTCPLLRKTAIYHILLLVTRDHVDRAVGKNMMSILAEELRTDGRELVRGYLIHFLEKWVLLNDFKNFPYWLAFDSQEEFFLENPGVVFATLWISNDRSMFDFCEVTTKSIAEMLKEHASIVIALMLGRDFNEDTERDEASGGLAAQVAIDELRKLDDDFNLFKVVTATKSPILYNVYKMFFDKETIDKIAGEELLVNCTHIICYPEKSSVHYTNKMIKKVLDCLRQLQLGSDLDYLDFVIIEHPCHFRNVLLLLAEGVINAPTPCDALTALVAFQSYVDLVLDYFNSTSFGGPPLVIEKLAVGLARDVTFSFIRVIRKWNKCGNDTIATLAFLYVRDDIEKHFISLMKGYERIVVSVIYALVDLILDECIPTLDNDVLKLLEVILEAESLRDDLTYLMPFPATPVFANLNMILEKSILGEDGTSLATDLSSFVDLYILLGFARTEMLQHVQAMLKEKKEQLKELLNEVEELNHSFFLYSDNPLHKTTQVLAGLVTSSDPVLRIEASKCLAELGAGDIRIGILVPQRATSSLSSNPKNPLHRLTFICLDLLPKYLLDLNPEVVMATSRALYEINNSKEADTTMRDEWPSQLRLATDYTIMEKSYNIGLSPSPLEFSEPAFHRSHDLWIPSGDCDHGKWIRALTTALLGCFRSTSSYLEKLVDICRLEVDFCEEILPFVLELFLKFGEISCQNTLFKELRRFFKVCYQTFSKRSNEPPVDVIRNKAAVVTMLDAVNYLNLQHYGIEMKIRMDRCKKLIKGSLRFDIDAIDYLHCAVAALHCSAFYSAIQYCHHWIGHVSKGNDPITLTHHIRANTPHVDEVLQILREAHSGLGDRDGLYGCGTSHLLQPTGRIEHFKNMDKWGQVMRSYELELGGPDVDAAVDGLLMSLQMLGMEEMLMGLMDARDQEDKAEFKYECAWRLGSWNLLSKFAEKKQQSLPLFFLEETPKTSIIYKVDHHKINAEFHKNLFLGIRSIRNGKYTEAMGELASARGYVLNSLAITSLEAWQGVYSSMCRLHALKEIEQFASAFKDKQEQALQFVLSEWEASDIITQKHFQRLEPVMALRLSLLKQCCIENNRRAVPVEITNHAIKAASVFQLQLGHHAREAGMYAISEKYLRAVRQLPLLSEDPFLQSRLKLEEAQLFWTKGDADVALVLIQDAMDCLKCATMDQAGARLVAEVATVHGHWVMKTHSDKAKTTLCKYFAHAMDILTEHKIDKESEEYLKAIRAMAKYSDEQYVLAAKYVTSDSFSKKQHFASRSMYVVSDYTGARGITSDEKRALQMFEKQAKLDEQELVACEAEKTSYLEIALCYYIKLLKFSPAVELDVVFRFVSLFLENCSDTESIFNDTESIPAYKFIPVISQLLPRIVLSKGKCSRTLKNIVENCAVFHPHHVLPPIFALAYSLQEIDNTKGSDAFITDTQKNNQKAAQRMVGRFRSNEKLTEHVNELTILWEALISMAYYQVEDTKVADRRMDPKVKLLTKVKDLSHVQILTVGLKENPAGEYPVITSVVKYFPEFSLVGGINVPKKITCLGSDGKSYPQLLKGRDDLRQDAVMQQVFRLMNALLHQDEKARERKLRIRSYRVVPLSHRSGIIEWCTTATSIGNYLHGYRNVVGAHSLYCPSDFPIRTCKHMMQDVHKSTRKVRLQVFLDICENLQPVFRHYFYSKYSNPAIWYEMKQSYTRSVATSSMIGYVLGLGDRHLQNILIDEITAEVLHVDLGIAFEQGLTLTTPETVPFRLTRDIVDGMGISGVEGVFRRSCEVTMELMRNNRQIILTVLEVLIYDPLYAWTLKPKFKILEAQLEARLSGGSSTTLTGDEEVVVRESPSLPSTVRSSSSSDSKPSESKKRKSSSPSEEAASFVSGGSTTQGERNTIAVRALERLEQKLLGTEDGNSASSVEAQVERLIQEAQDPENLCMLYPGWQPYL
ncbi:serine-protein kinase ATM [Ischnura elegans]|uniref:serine-protein kinase ATM n=1 Tax=Ischnura elegans TaxID=197161 RepID=UPI001ED88F83|nr:serine-protein kinase ATM [Ischnura elegans]